MAFSMSQYMNANTGIMMKNINSTAITTTISDQGTFSSSRFSLPATLEAPPKLLLKLLPNPTPLLPGVPLFFFCVAILLSELTSVPPRGLPPVQRLCAATSLQKTPTVQPIRGALYRSSSLEFLPTLHLALS